LGARVGVDLRSFVQLLRSQWILVIVVVALATGGSAALTARMTPLYASSVTFYASAHTNSNDPAMAYQGSLLSQQEVQSYADLITGPMLARRVVNALGLAISPAQLSAQMSSRVIPQTVLLTATVTNPAPSQAQLIANSVGRQFVQLVASLERPPGGGPPTVQIKVVASAGLPVSPVSPNLTRNVGIALGLGLLLGIGLAAARRALDTRIKTPDQLAKSTGGKPVIGSIPFDGRARRRPLLESDNPFGNRAEAFRKIGTNLRFIDVDLPHKVLLFTSALPEEGKSSTVCNLAITLARSGKRVLIIEADLRRPRVASYLGLPNGAGVTSVLSGRQDPYEAIQMWGDDLFSVLSSGPSAPNPSDLLGSQRMRILIEQLGAQYDVVLVDAPPVLPFADTVATAPACHGTILVVRQGKTREEHVRQTVEALETVGSSVLGTVLSMVSGAGKQPEYSYGYRRYRHMAEQSTASDMSEENLAAGSRHAKLP
jgi:capsular exopolysaccharide synthesis family protein